MANIVYCNSGPYGTNLTGVIGPMVQGQGGQTMTLSLLALDGSDVDVSGGFTGTGTLKNTNTGATVAIDGVLTGGEGSFTWGVTTTDTGTSGMISAVFKFTDGSTTYQTFPVALLIIENPSVTAIAGDPLEGVPSSDAAWLAAANDTGNALSDYVQLAGDTMTGPLDFSGIGHLGLRLNSLTTLEIAFNPEEARGGVIVYNSTEDSIWGFFGAAWWRMATQVDLNNHLKKAGGTMSGALTFSGTTNSGITLNNLTTAQRNALTPAAGMLVYDTDIGAAFLYAGGTWKQLATV